MYSEQEIQAIKISRDKHFEPKSLQNYKANRTKAQAEQQLLQSIFDPDVVQLIKAKADNKQKIADMNGFLRVFFA